MVKPFFTYYGGKWRAAPKYPKPKHGTIIEPFAGAAGYSVRYADRDVILIDANPVIAGLWRYLIKVSAAEIRTLPLQVRSVDDLNICQEAKWLIGFWLTAGNLRPVKTPNAWMRGGTNPGSFWGESIRERVATQVEKIRHWKVLEASYETAPDLVATWFIDPPYKEAGKAYYGGKALDYETLALWCQERKGQTMVCESEGADWLPFKPFQVLRSLPPGSRGKLYSREAIWTRDDADSDEWSLV